MNTVEKCEVVKTNYVIMKAYEHRVLIGLKKCFKFQIHITKTTLTMRGCHIIATATQYKTYANMHLYIQYLLYKKFQSYASTRLFKNKNDLIHSIGSLRRCHNIYRTGSDDVAIPVMWHNFSSHKFYFQVLSLDKFISRQNTSDLYD